MFTVPIVSASASSTVSSFQQCANGAPGTTPSTACTDWINGDLQKTNSQYAEGQVVPQRVVLNISTNTSHSIVLDWEDRKGSAQAHAYDSLATWNTTENTASPCQGIGNFCGGTANPFPIPLDNTEVPPCVPQCTSDVTSAHQLHNQNFIMYGGTITGTSGYTHTAAATPTADDDTSITVNFNASPGSTVVFLYGGHLAAGSEPGGWGQGVGSANINGGPYHQRITSVDDASSGQRDNNIQSGAILGPPNLTISKSATPNPVAAGGTVTYTITVQNVGASPASTTFTDTFSNTQVKITSGVTSNPPGANCSITGTTITCATATLGQGQSQTFTFTAMMPSTFTGTPDPNTGTCPGNFEVQNVATLASNGAEDADADEPGPQVTFTECVIAAPQFTISKSANPTTANPGDIVTYTITVTNIGSAPGSTSFQDQNQAGVTEVTFVSSNPSTGNCTPGTPATTLNCTTGTLAPGGGFQTFKITAKMPTSFTGSPGAPGSTCPGTFPVIDTVTLTGGSSANATVCVNASPTFTITKIASPTSTTPGQPVTYTITVKNTGTAPGSTGFQDVNDPNVTIVSFPTQAHPTTSPPGGFCSFQSGSTTTLNCSTTSLNPGNQMVFTIVARMPSTFSGSPGGGNCGMSQFPVMDTATLTTGGSDSATVCVTASPTFVIMKKADTANAQPGQTVTYTITVQNQGSASGFTTFTDANDPNVTIVSFPTQAQPTTSPPGGFCSVDSGSATTLDCTTSTISAGGQQVFTVKVKMPSSFTGNPGGDNCGPNQFPVIDTVTLANGGTDHATVCVTANPNIVFNKTANVSSANPGDPVMYTITATNNGQAPGANSFTDSSNPPPSSIGPVTITLSPPGTPPGSCTEDQTTKTISCNTGVLDPGQTETFTYTAHMPLTFSGNPGGDSCGPNQFPVVNTITPGNSLGTVSVGTSAKVCVTATPNLTLSKSAQLVDTNGNNINPPATTGDGIVYTITYGNTGTADANNTVITDTIPAGTVFLGCSNSCSVMGSPISSVSWNIGTVPAGATGLKVTLTVGIVTVTACSISNTADISSPNFTPPGGVAGGNLPATVSIAAVPGPNPAGANSSGTATGVEVNLLNLVTTTIPSPPTHTQQGGIGESQMGTSVANPSVSGVLTASLISTSNDAKVIGGPGAIATDRATAETVGACVLPVAGLCTVGASVILANAQTSASDSQASISSAGSTFAGLKVMGLPLANVAPNTCINLPSALFGANSFVGLFVQSPSSGNSGFPTTCPPSGQTGSAGLTKINGVAAFAGDLTVTMVYVHVTNLIGLGKVDVAVSQATAHSDFPPLTPNCGGPSNIQSVSGDAFVASEDTTPSIIPALVGYVSIPPTGGDDLAALASLFLPPSNTYTGASISAGAANSHTFGALTSTSSWSDSGTSVAGLCIMPVAGATGPPGPKTCTIYASLAKSVSYSTATAAGAKSTTTDAAGPNVFGGTEFLNLTIGGQGLTLPVTPNMSLLPAALPIEIILDEQTCDDGSPTNTGVCTGANHSGLTVTAIHVIVLGPTNGLPIGAEIKVAQAHSDATFATS